ncbi:diguanylate cyclase (GGDEF) domain protein [Congregibacter litoralis KT71]|uniref:diguanylate cyclase n=1 Tax=Congregibacter litoralis KT71 TaxID=314285 RepID=A4A339_9GAMM|nr:diguanylate cyclase (GGDEF) domain protein [Congregibacter litoralis KT71]
MLLLSIDSAKSITKINAMVDLTMLANHLLISVVDAETGQRGYILTGKESYLESYYSGSAAVLVDLEKLKRLGRDTPRSLQLIDRIEDLTKKKLMELKETVSLYREGDKDSALEIVNSDIGKQFMEALRRDIADLESTLEGFAIERQKDLSSLQRLIFVLLFAEAAIFAAAMMVTYYRVRKFVVEPLTRLTAAVRHHRLSDTFAPVDIESKDEIGDLAEAYNELGARFYSAASDLVTSAEEANEAKEKAYLDSVTDSLTGLNNRRYLRTMAPKLLGSAHRHKHDLSILMIDVDHFKTVNDSFGHAAGDAVLAEIGVLLREETRVSDFVVRYGGEEFLLILDHTDLERGRKRLNTSGR